MKPILIFCAMLIAFFAVAQDDALTATEHETEARALTLMSNGDYTAAISLLKPLLKPNYLDTYTNLAYAYALLGNVAEGKKYFDIWFSAHPKDALGYSARAEWQQNFGTPNEKAADYKKALSLNANEPAALAWTGLQVSIKEGDCATAITYYTKALLNSKVNPNFTGGTLALCYHNRAYCYTKQEKYALAIADLNEAIKENPNESQHWVERAFAHLGNKDAEKALPDARKALELNADNDQIHYVLVLALRNVMQVDDALTAANTAVAKFPNECLLYQMRAAVLNDRGYTYDKANREGKHKTGCDCTTMYEPENVSPCKSGNCYNGTGTYSFQSGNRFVGTFKEGHAGKGKWFYSNNDTYEGETKQGAKEGQGVYTFAADNATFTGVYRNDAEYTGVYAFANGSAVKINCGITERQQPPKAVQGQSGASGTWACGVCSGRGSVSLGMSTRTVAGVNDYQISTNWQGKTTATTTRSPSQTITTNSAPRKCPACFGDGVCGNDGLPKF